VTLTSSFIRSASRRPSSVVTRTMASPASETTPIAETVRGADLPWQAAAATAAAASTAARDGIIGAPPLGVPAPPGASPTRCVEEAPRWRFIRERRAISLDAGCGWARGKADVLYVADAFRVGMTLEEVFEETAVDPWFLAQIEQLVQIEHKLAGRALGDLSAAELRLLKTKGFSDKRLAKLLGTHQHAVRERRHALNVRPVYKRVDTCAAEFATQTAYMYSTYEEVEKCYGC